MAAGVLLDAAPALIEGVTGQADDVKRVHDRDRVGELFGGGGLEPVNPFMATTCTASRQGCWRAAS